MSDGSDLAGTTRRDLIKKGAVAGAIVWSVPVVTSAATPAAAFTLPLDCELDCSACLTSATEYLLVGTREGTEWTFAFADTVPPIACQPCGYTSPLPTSPLVPVVEPVPGGFSFSAPCPDGGTVTWKGWTAVRNGNCAACDVIDSSAEVVEIQVDRTLVDVLYVTVCADCDEDGDTGGQPAPVVDDDTGAPPGPSVDDTGGEAPAFAG